MTDFANSFIENATQCWGCGIFDALFQVVSNAGAAVYSRVAYICIGIFAVLFTFYVFWVVLKHMNPKKPDTSKYSDTIGKVVINSLFALTLLGIGVAVPRFVSMITFEPVANVALVYSQAALNTNTEFVNEHVKYTPTPMADNGLYRPELRDSVIMLMKTTITEFQSYMKLGIVVMDKAFTWRALLGIGSFLKHVIIFAMGLYLLYGFMKLFLRFCFCFVDVIIAMAMFAFFFPISIMMMSFKGSQMPEWMSKIGSGLGADQIKKLINAIVTVAASVIVYTVIMVIIARFFAADNVSTTELMNAITSGQVFESDLSYDNVLAMTFGGAIVLLYVLNFIYSQIPQISKMVLSVFNIEESDKFSKQMADDMEKLAGLLVNNVKTVGSVIINKGEKKESDTDKKSDEKSSDEKPKDDKKK